MNLEQKHVADVLHDLFKLCLLLGVKVLALLNLLGCLVWLCIDPLTLEVFRSELPRFVNDGPQVGHVCL